MLDDVLILIPKRNSPVDVFLIGINIMQRESESMKTWKMKFTIKSK